MPPPSIFSPAIAATHTLRRSDVEALVGHRIHDLDHYRTAFVHKSMFRVVGASCERGELLGDAVLNLVVAGLLLASFPTATEGFITRVRVKVVSGKQLTKFAKALELDRWLVLSNNARTMNVGANDRILEDVFEAFIGALYTDMGFAACEVFIKRIIRENIDMNSLVTEDNFKDILAKFAQQQSPPLVVEYELKSSVGPAHKRMFTTIVRVGGDVCGEGAAPCKKESEMNAAKHALLRMNVDVTSAIGGCEGII